MLSAVFFSISHSKNGVDNRNMEIRIESNGMPIASVYGYFLKKSSIWLDYTPKGVY